MSVQVVTGDCVGVGDQLAHAGDQGHFLELAGIRTAKYRPEFPVKGFADLEQARRWAMAFVHWFNVDHRHSGIRYVSPAQRHAGEDHAILAARHAVYLQAHERNPARWSRHTRNWTPNAAVNLHPEKDVVAGIMSKSSTYSAMAA